MNALYGSDIAETQLVQMERIDISIYRTNRIVPADVILQTRRQKTCLIAAVADLVGTVHHTTNCTPGCRPGLEILAQPLRFSALRLLAEILAGVPDDEQAKIVGGNTARVYNFDVTKLTAPA